MNRRALAHARSGDKGDMSVIALASLRSIFATYVNDYLLATIGHALADSGGNASSPFTVARILRTS